MIFPVKRVKEELINEFAVSNMTIENFSKVHSIQPEALKSWIQEKFSVRHLLKIIQDEYLSSVFELAADTTGWTDSKWSELLPWNIKLISKSDVSTVPTA